jgi:acylphosphatase
MEKIIAMQIQVFGRVQGVGFRYYTQKKANELEIAGFVKNKADGSVFIEAEGIEKTLNEFLLWCHKGPSWARVQDVKFQEMPPLNYSDFKIK